MLEQRASGRAEVEVQYRRAVTSEGNRTALAILARCLKSCDAAWRGIGVLAQTGLEPSEEFEAMDARRKVQVPVPKDVVDLPAGCGCGEVMKGLKVPNECGMFGTACTPSRPIGPCMVSTEGACAAWYRYGRG